MTDTSSSNKSGRYLVYSLPRATITIDVPITRTLRAAGGCAKGDVLDLPVKPTPPPAAAASTAPSAAGSGASPKQGTTLGKEAELSYTIKDRLRELGIEPQKQNASKIEIGDALLGVRMENDPDQVFAIRLHSGVLDSKKFALEMNEDGTLSTASFESSNKLADLSVKVITNAASVIASAAKFGGGAKTIKSADLGSHCRAVMLKIGELRTKREALVTGQASTNGTPKDAFDLMLTELRGLEESLVAEFSGTKTLEKAVARCEWTPTGKMTSPAINQRLELFGFSNLKLSKADLCVVPALLKNPGKLDGGSPAEEPAKTVALEVKGDASFAQAAARYEPDPGSESGLYFRVPVRVTASLRVGADERLRSRMDIPQYGEVVSLPGHADIKGASLAATAKFGPAGGLTSLSHSVSPIDAGAVIDATGAATKMTLDALKARKDADVEALEREKKRLQLRRDIEKLEAGEELEE